jgi:hypothetical protein
VIGGEDIFKPTTGNTSLHKIYNDNGVRVVNFVTSKNPTVKSTMLPHHNIHKFTWTSPDGKMHNQIDILTDRRWHSSILDVRPFRRTDCDTDHYLVVAKVREKLAVSKQTTHKVHTEGFNLEWVRSFGKLKTMWWILIELGKLLETISKFQPKRV